MGTLASCAPGLREVVYVIVCIVLRPSGDACSEAGPSRLRHIDKKPLRDEATLFSMFPFQTSLLCHATSKLLCLLLLLVEGDEWTPSIDGRFSLSVFRLSGYRYFYCGARAGVRVLLGEENDGDEMEEYLMVPYSRNANSASKQNYLETAMVSESAGPTKKKVVQRPW